jgi:hypothetical protein
VLDKLVLGSQNGGKKVLVEVVVPVAVINRTRVMSPSATQRDSIFKETLKI